MVTFEFSAEELEILIDELEGRVADLENELAHTDRKDFKLMLRHRRATLDGLLERMRHLPVTA